MYVVKCVSLYNKLRHSSLICISDVSFVCSVFRSSNDIYVHYLIYS
jgi:hypothetical protein